MSSIEDDFAWQFLKFSQIQDENWIGSNEIPVIENLLEFRKCSFGWPNGTSDLDFHKIILQTKNSFPFLLY